MEPRQNGTRAKQNHRKESGSHSQIFTNPEWKEADEIRTPAKVQ